MAGFVVRAGNEVEAVVDADTFCAERPWLGVDPPLPIGIEVDVLAADDPERLRSAQYDHQLVKVVRHQHPLPPPDLQRHSIDPNQMRMFGGSPAIKKGFAPGE